MLLVTYDTEQSDLEFNRFDPIYYEDPTAFTSSNQTYNDEFEEVSSRPFPSLPCAVRGESQCEPTTASH